MAELPPYSNLTTSKDAAESVRETYPKTQKKVLDLLREAPRSCDEIEQLTGLSHQSASSAIRKLTKAGVLIDSRKTSLTRSGRRAIQWKVATP